MGYGELGNVRHDSSLFKRFTMPACISVLDPVNEAEYPFLVNVTHPCAFAILVDDFYDASQFLDTL